MPAKKKIQTRQVNLIPQEGLSSTTGGKVLLWILSTFRIILIITEIFVIAAFISRFWLDTKNSDITEEMKENKVVISSLSSFEENFKDIQNRLDIFNSYKANEGEIISEIKEITTYKPQGVYFLSIDANLEKISISAISVSEIELQQFFVNLKSGSSYEKVGLGDILLAKENSTINYNICDLVK